jgi:LysR family transcriptional regulator, low CO2-responsive transcriptional regulator
VLTIGIVSTAKYFVPHLLTRFHEAHPGVEVKLAVAANREELVALMQAGEADLTIMGRPPKEIATRSQSFAPHPLVFVAPAGHPLGRDGGGSGPGRRRVRHAGRAAAGTTRMAGVSAADIAACPLIAREPASGTRVSMDRYFAERRVTPRITMEMPSNESIKQAVIAGMGLSFLSLHTVGLELKNGLLQVLDVEGTPLMRAWNVVHLGSKVLSPAAEAFRNFMLAAAEDYLREHDAPLLAGQVPSAPRRTRAAGSPGGSAAA